MNKFGDTPNNHANPSLCLSCRSGQTVTGLRINDTFTLCRLNGMDALRMPQPVLTCSDYDDKGQTPLWQMEKIAWRFSVDNRKKTMGFLTPTEFKHRVKAGTEVDDD